jgi:hypothetical protein
MITAIIILSIMVVILGFTTFNLLKKIETAEDIVLNYLLYLDKISKVIDLSDKRLKKIDAKGTFKSDDEVGFFFEEIKQIQKILNDFNMKKTLKFLWIL